LSARAQRVSMRIIVASLALCAVFALALGETEIDESVFQAIEDDVAQTVQTLKGLQGDDVAVTELDDESAAPKAKKAGKKKAKKAIAKAKAAGAKKVKKDKKNAKDKLKKQAKKKAAKLKKLRRRPRNTSPLRCTSRTLAFAASKQSSPARNSVTAGAWTAPKPGY